MGSGKPSQTSRHEQAVARAEVLRLMRGLAPYRVLHRDALREVTGADKWHNGGFDRALREAVRSGSIEALPGNFYRIPPTAQLDRDRSQDMPSEQRSSPM